MDPASGYLIRKEDFPKGVATAGDVERLGSLLNPYLSQLSNLTAKGITFSDNIACEFQIAQFTHGIASQISLKKLNAAKGLLLLGCDTAIPSGAVLSPVLDSTGVGRPRVNVTVWFQNPTANAKVALLLLPEGQQSVKAPADLAWTAPTLINSWANVASFLPAGYLKDAGGFVHLRGQVNTGAAGNNAFVLPAGYRPSARADFNTSYGAISVRADGSVLVVSVVTGQAGFDGITFDTRS